MSQQDLTAPVAEESRETPGVIKPPQAPQLAEGDKPSTLKKPVPLFEQVPHFKGNSPRNPSFSFSSLGGRPIVLMFFGSMRRPGSAAIVKKMQTIAEAYKDKGFIVCAICADPDDKAQERIDERTTFIVFWDFDGEIANQFGIPHTAPQNAEFPAQSLVIDPRLRLYSRYAFNDPDAHIRALVADVDACRYDLPAVRQQGWAPVLEIPRVFELQLCRQLIDYYNNQGGRPSGFMRQQAGQTIGVLDRSFKRRSDVQIKDKDLMDACRRRIARRVAPEIQKAFQFNANRVERDIVACYSGEEKGFFNAHRDNTTSGTAHRRFAVTVNLNAEEYEGGELKFPEFGPATYKAPTGGAVVFSCSLLHQATPVTRGLRYCYLPFLYDDTAAEVRKANMGTIDFRTRDSEGRYIDEEGDAER